MSSLQSTIFYTSPTTRVIVRHTYICRPRWTRTTREAFAEHLARHPLAKAFRVCVAGLLMGLQAAKSETVAETVDEDEQWVAVAEIAPEMEDMYVELQVNGQAYLVAIVPPLHTD